MSRLENAPNLPIIEEMRLAWDDAVANQKHWATFPARTIMERISLYQLYNGVAEYASWKASTADRPSDIFKGINGQSIGAPAPPNEASPRFLGTRADNQSGRSLHDLEQAQKLQKELFPERRPR